MKLQMFQVDAFTDEVLSGNPAAICPLTEWLPDDQMQAVALENNLSETAFIVKQFDGTYRLRWFTPTTEVDLCGHATLASAYVIWHCLEDPTTELQFDTRSGRLQAGHQDGMIALHFPESTLEPCPDPPATLAEGLGRAPIEVWTVGTDKQRGSYLAVYNSEDQVRGLNPDFRTLGQLGSMAVNPTAPGGDVDFVSRYFAPTFGIDEDPVTGSAHCALTPFWSERLGKDKLRARQVSARGGELRCERRPDCIVIAGKAALYMEATITL
jgi:PhzF family phenazine biosynthesis protein